MSIGLPETPLEIELTNEIIALRRGEASTMRMFADVLESTGSIPMVPKEMRGHADFLDRLADMRSARLPQNGEKK